ncbi:MAG: Hsp20/alpha crystallin family protein [Gammaproteobacteria bacterium]
MASLDSLKQGLDRAWDNLHTGWQSLVDRAAQAITRFRPGEPRADDTEDSLALARISPGWGLMAAEIRESDDEVTVRLEIPGMNPEEFDIDAQDDLLRVRGEKHAAREETRGTYHVTERAYGRFERVLQLPARVDSDGARADYRRGVLTIRLPKHPSAVSRRISVSSR